MASTKVSIYSLLAKYKSKRSSVLNRVLFICDAGIGDLILTLPLIQAFSRDFLLEVYVLTNQKSASLLMHDKRVVRLMVLENFANDPESLVTMLNKYNFDGVISIRTPSWLIWRYGVCGSHGVWVKHSVFERYIFLKKIRSKLSAKFRRTRYGCTHMVNTIWEMGKKILPLEDCNISKPTIYIGPQDEERVKNVLINRGIINKKIIVIHTSGADPIKTLSNTTVSTLIEHFEGKAVILVGAESEHRQRLSKIEAGYEHAVSLAGFLTLTETVVLIRDYADVFIGPDSGLAHLTATTGKPMIVLMGSAQINVWGPLAVGDLRVLHRKPACSPCNKKVCYNFAGRSCIQDISADEIIGSYSSLVSK